MPDTAVVAAARPIDSFEGLEKLKQDFEARLLIIKMELLEADTIQARHDLP